MNYGERLLKIKNDILNKQFPEGWEQIEEIINKAIPGRNLDSYHIPRAELFREILENIDIDIEEGQLLAGSIEPAFTGSYDLYGDSQYFNSYGNGKKFRDFLNQEAFNEELQKVLTEEEKLFAEEMLAIGKRVSGHAVPDYKKVLDEGLQKIINTVKSLKSKTKDLRKKMFYESCIISCSAIIDFAERYAEKAEEYAAKEKNTRRSAELREIARICRKVPRYPAESFHEALQSFWFVYAGIHIEQFPNPYAFSVGRFDTFMKSFLNFDIQKGEIDEDGILELLGCLWLKFLFNKHAWAVSQNILLGGQNAAGNDSSNYLTSLCLKITGFLKMPQPSVAVRIFEKTDNETFNETLRLVKSGIGMPSFHNDKSVIAALVNEGIDRKDAIEYAIAGCQEPVVQGKENGRTTAGKFNLLKCLEITLNEGKTFISGRQLGLKFDELDKIADYKDFYDLFLKQVDYVFGVMVSAHNKSDYLLSVYKPVPFISCIMDNCLQNGKDFNADGAKYNSSGVLVHGLASTADALTAIKKLVFEQKTITFKELVKNLKGNFEDDIQLQKTILNTVPKFGNDDDYADSVASELAEDICEIAGKYKNYFNGRYRIGFNTPSTHIHYGAKTGPTPDGRKSGDPFSYGTGPAQGRCRKGPTAILNSMSKLPQKLISLGTDLSLSVNISDVDSEEKLLKLGALIKSYFEMGGHHVMFNIVDWKTLKSAQVNPEKYEDLVVRVHGYSSYFNSLTKEVQNELIERVRCGL